MGRARCAAQPCCGRRGGELKKQFRVKHAPIATGGYVDSLYARRPRKPTKAQIKADRILKDAADRNWRDNR